MGSREWMAGVWAGIDGVGRRSGCRTAALLVVGMEVALFMRSFEVRLVACRR